MRTLYCAGIRMLHGCYSPFYPGGRTDLSLLLSVHSAPRYRRRPLSSAVRLGPIFRPMRPPIELSSVYQRQWKGQHADIRDCGSIRTGINKCADKCVCERKDSRCSTRTAYRCSSLRRPSRRSPTPAPPSGTTPRPNLTTQGKKIYPSPLDHA